MPREETDRVPGEAAEGTHGFQQLCSVQSSTRSLKQLSLESPQAAGSSSRQKRVEERNPELPLNRGGCLETKCREESQRRGPES